MSRHGGMRGGGEDISWGDIVHLFFDARRPVWKNICLDLGGAGGSHCFSLDRNLSMPLEPKLAPCGWRCPHRCPALTGPFGNW